MARQEARHVTGGGEARFTLTAGFFVPDHSMMAGVLESKLPEFIACSHRFSSS